MNKKSGQVIRVLKKMDEELAKEGFFQYQKRIYRIYKTMLSIEKHNDRIVSNFSLTENEKLEKNEKLTQSQQEFNLSNFTDEDDLEEEKEEMSTSRFEFDDILSYIEDKLALGRADSFEANSKSFEKAIDEGDDEKFTKKKHKRNQSYHKNEIQKIFSKIAIRLRAYLKETTLFNASSFDNIFNDYKLKTPMPSIESNKVCLPSIMKNFFMDESIIQQSKILYSAKEGMFKKQFSNLGFSKQVKMCKSVCNNFSYRKRNLRKEVITKITNFSIDNDENKLNIPDWQPTDFIQNFHFTKRDSIFREKLNLDNNIAEEHKGELEIERSSD
jgi:hypothetical protein